jgi:transcriptional regulator with XRE-family HTH domain
MAKPRAETPAETFARRVKAARDRQKLTQTELATRSELTAAAISQIESGDRIPAFKTIVALARALGTTPNDLMGMEEEQLDPSLQELKGLFRDLKDMSSEDFEKVKGYASYLVAERKTKG